MDNSTIIDKGTHRTRKTLESWHKANTVEADNGCGHILVTSIAKTGITIVSYFGNVTACLFALAIVRKITPR